MSADPITEAEALFAAATNADGEIVPYYLACARMAVVQATQRLEVIDRMVTAREGELARLAKLARGGG